MKSLSHLVAKFLNARGWVKLARVDCFATLQTAGYPLPEFIDHKDAVNNEGDVLARFGRHVIADMPSDNSVALELGVAAGYFSDSLLRSKRIGKLFSVDCWADHHDDREYLLACARLAKHGTRSILMRSFFDDVLALFPDEYFDLIYIDAYAHTGQQDGKLLTDWYPKLKQGGIFSGHDYDPKHWPETVKAVDAFAVSVAKKILVIPGVRTANPQDQYPSWRIVK